MSINKFRDVHESLCHLGETRIAHFVKVRSLPSCIDQIRQIIRLRQACGEYKPEFYWSTPMNSIKVTQPFEGLNIDFKSPLPPANQNRYIRRFVTKIPDFLSLIPYGM